jgi:hypothetical protein
MGLLALPVILAGLPACTRINSPRAAEQAREQFSQDDFCPVSRVSVKRIIPLETAPPAVASDPARVEMWQDTADMHADADPRKTFEVTGCGDRVTYSCWYYPEMSQRGSEQGASCIAQQGTAQPAGQDQGPSAMPKGGDGP